MKFPVLLPLFFALIACSSEPPPALQAPVPADLILTNARVYTLAWPDPLPSGGVAGSAPWDAGYC